MKWGLIRNQKLFRDNFSFGEIWEDMDSFFCEFPNIRYIDKEKKETLFALIRKCFQKETDDVALDPLEVYDADYEKQREALFLKAEPEKIASLKAALDDMPDRAEIFCAVLALHSLADSDMNLDDIIGIVNKSGELQQCVVEKNTAGVETDTSNDELDFSLDLSGDEIIVESLDKPYIVYQYTYDAGKNFRISVNKITNYSQPEFGEAIIHVIGIDNKLIYTVELCGGESVYAHSINGKLVRFLPRISANESYCVYKEKEKLYRHIFANNKSVVYGDDKLCLLQQFSVTPDGGFVGILNGEIEAYTGIDYSFPEFQDETPVYVSVSGELFVIMTDKGNIKTNFVCAENWSGIVWMHFDADFRAYGITYNGNIVEGCLSDKLILNKIKGRKDVVSVSTQGEYAVAQTLNGNIVRQDGTYVQIDGEAKLCKSTVVTMKKSVVCCERNAFEPIHGVSMFDTTGKRVVVKPRRGLPIVKEIN